MGNIIDDIAQLSEHIGPRPAGTEEEQQAALYIADELQKDAGFSTVIEDFNCLTNGSITRTICFAIGFLAALVSLVVPAIEALCFVLGALSAVLYVLEMLGKDTLSRFFHNGVSQNVVAKYQPVSAHGTSRSRKIILVANYDSEKEDKKFQTPLAGMLDKIRLVVLTGFCVSPVIILIKMVLLPGDTGAANAFFTALLIVCLVLMALPLIDSVLRRVSPYNQAANNNAAGVGVLLETARTIGNGLVSEEEVQQRAKEEGTTVHGKEAASEAGVLPQDAEVEYEAPKRTGRTLSPEESLAAAKAAIAALTGRPVADKVPVTDIASKLVQAGQSADAESANVHFEVDERVDSYNAQNPVSANASSRGRVFAEVDNESSDGGTRESVHVMPREQFERAQEQRVAQRAAQMKEASANQESDAQAQEAAFSQGNEATSFTRERPEALRTGQTGMGERISKTPAWAKAAQAKAHANRPDLAEAGKSVARSRFADTPAAHLTDEALAAAGVTVHAVPAPTHDVPEQPVSEEQVAGEEQAQPMTELEARLAALRSEIESTQAPHVSSEARAALDNMGDKMGTVREAAVASTASAKQEIAVNENSETPEPKAVSPDVTAPISQTADNGASRLSSTAARNDASAEQGQRHVLAQAASTATAASQTARSDSAKSLGAPTSANPASATDAQHTQASVLLAKPVPADNVSSASAASETQVIAGTAQNKNGSTEAISPIDVSSFLNKETKPQSQQYPPATSAAAQSMFVTGDANDAPAAEQPANQSVSAQQPEQSAVSPIMGMESISPLQSAAIPRIDVEEEHNKEQRKEQDHNKEHQVIVLPDVATVASAQSDEGKQRAPMAAGSESTQSGSKALLSNMLPRIDDSASQSDSIPDESGSSLAHEEPHAVEHNTVSATGSFSIVGETGSFEAVGDDLIADIDPNELYVEDADDSGYDQEYTETGAFAGTGYVDMPKSRAQRLFGRFKSKKKKNKEQEQSMTDWIDADETYDARSVGKARGSWKSFRNEEVVEEEFAVDQANNASSHAGAEPKTAETNEGASSRGWNGGAFSLSSFRKNKRASKQEEIADDEADFYEESDALDQSADVSDRLATGTMNAVDSVTDTADVTSQGAQQTGPVDADEAQPQKQPQQKDRRINEELKKLKNFRFPGIDTEVWFVALGAEYANNSGMQAFMNEHADELKGSIIINLEALGAGELTLIDEEGLLKKQTVSSRIKRILHNASEQTGIGYATAALKSRNTTSLYVKNRGHQALTLMGMKGAQPALYGSKDDVIDNIDEQLLAENAAFVMALLKNI